MLKAPFSVKLGTTTVVARAALGPDALHCMHAMLSCLMGTHVAIRAISGSTIKAKQSLSSEKRAPSLGQLVGGLPNRSPRGGHAFF